MVLLGKLQELLLEAGLPGAASVAQAFMPGRKAWRPDKVEVTAGLFPLLRRGAIVPALLKRSAAVFKPSASTFNPLEVVADSPAIDCNRLEIVANSLATGLDRREVVADSLATGFKRLATARASSVARCD
jgi:hypothetical protein